MMYSRYILIPGKDGKNRQREIGIATTNSDNSLTCWDDLPVPVDPSTGRPCPVFMREIVQKDVSAQPTASNGVQQELPVA